MFALSNQNKQSPLPSNHKFPLYSSLIVCRKSPQNPTYKVYSKGFDGVKLFTKNFGKWSFFIHRASLDEKASDKVVLNTNIGDTIQIKISKMDYKKRLMKTDSLDFFDKQLDWETNIEVYGFKFKGSVYFDMK